MSQAANPPPIATAEVKRQQFLAALAIVPIMASVYQTLVLTDVTDDVIRKGIDAEHYSMIWTNVCWGVMVLYGVFGGIWAMLRYGARDTLQVGLVWFAVGNVLCGAATDVTTLALAKLVEGVGKGMVIVICRSTLYRQFDRMVIVAIGLYGTIAYATRPSTPLITAWVNDALSWRWIFWVNVPLALLALPLVRRYFRPDRPPQPRSLAIDWIGITLFMSWIVSLTFVFGWYRKWGGWSSNAFTATAVLAMLLPFVTLAWVTAGLSRDEHLKRMFRVRGYVLAMYVRTLMLLQLLAGLTLLANYCLELRDYPREVTGWILAPAAATMAISTLLTTWYRPRALRHVWLMIGVLGCAGCLWWMSAADNFTSKEQLAWMIGCWGLFLGLFPPAFLQDEVEALAPQDFIYSGAVAVVVLIVPIVVIPTMTSTIVSAWADRAADAQRLNLAQNRPEVEASAVRIADYYRQRGVSGPELTQLTSTVLGSLVKSDAVSAGIQSGLRFLSIVVLGTGVPVTVLLAAGRSQRPS